MTCLLNGTSFVYSRVSLIFKYNHHVSKKKQFDITKFDE